MKKALILLIPLLMSGCSTPKNNSNNTGNGYGAFLGRSSNDIKRLSSYKYVSLEAEEYDTKTIKVLQDGGTNVLLYLNVGSIEEYRSYYSSFADHTIGEYENWEDEKWMDVTYTPWQSYVVDTLAASIKSKNAFGVYMDNVDVYSIAKEQALNYKNYMTALKNIIKGVSNLGLKVMVNGGAELFDDANDSGDDIFNYVWGYHQEEVFSLIDDYDNDVFTKQDKEDSDYYKDIASMMKKKNKEIFFLEYTVNEELIKQITSYCESKNYYYYCSKTVDLK